MNRRIISALIVFLLLASVAVLTAGASVAENPKPSPSGGIINTKTRRKEYYILKADKEVSAGSSSCSMGVSKHYSLEFGLILDAVSICVYSYHYRHTAEVVDTAGRSGVSSDAFLVVGRWRIVFEVLPEGYAVGKHRSMKSYPVDICEKKYNGVVYECLCDETYMPCGG